METAGLAGAAVVTATMGPGGMATASTGEMARGAGPVTAASAGAVGASAGSRGAGPGGELGAQSALGPDMDSGEAFWLGPTPTASKAAAAFCSSSRLLAATRGAFLGTHVLQAPRALSGPWFRPAWVSPWPVSTGELHLGPDSEQQKGWKSANLAQPFSSGAEVLGEPAAHTLEPTSRATAGAGLAAMGVTGPSNTAHEEPASEPPSHGEPA